MDPLATISDLAARDITHTSTHTLDTLLAAASAEVRSAAGVPISRETVTVSWPGTPRQWLTMPCQPIVSVADVLLDGDEITDWRKVGGRLWRRSGWAVRGEPVEVTATITGGLDPVPEDIVDLVCSMVGAGLARAVEGGYASRDDLASVRIDDFAESYITASGDRLAGVMELPRATRRRLAARFGGGAYVVEAR